MRQQNAEESTGSVHNRSLHAGGKRQANVEENVLDRGLRDAQYRQLPALTRIQAGNRLTLRQREEQQQRAGKQKAKTILDGTSSVAI